MQNNNGDTALTKAIRNGDETAVETLLSEGWDPWQEDAEWRTPYDTAIDEDQLEIAKLLLRHYVELYSDKAMHNKLLLLAAEAGNSRVVKMLLDEGANIDYTGTPGVHEDSHLHRATTPRRFAKKNVSRILLHQGRKINGLNESDFQAGPLYWAAQKGNSEVVRLLLASGAQVDLPDLYGCTALHAAAFEGHEETAELLLSNGADPNERDDDQWTPLHAAVLRGHEKLIRLLVDKISSGEQKVRDWRWALNQEDRKNKLDEIAAPKTDRIKTISGLRMACNSGDAGRVRALLDDGADINAIDANGGCTALTVAVRACKGDQDIVQILLKSGADPDIREEGGKTALYIAVENRFAEVARLLIEAGADVNLGVYGRTPILAWKFHNTEIAECLIKHGANIKARDCHGLTALHLAARYGAENMIARLIDAGADINSQDNSGRTPLVCAIEKPQYKSAYELLARGADLTIRAEDGTTVLHSAAFCMCLELVRHLLEKRADVNAQALGGLTPLHVATVVERTSTGTKQVEMVKVLLDRGAKKRATWHIRRDGDGKADDSNNGSKFSQLLLPSDIWDPLSRVSNYRPLIEHVYEHLRLTSSYWDVGRPAILTAQGLAALNWDRNVYELMIKWSGRRTGKAAGLLQL